MTTPTKKIAVDFHRGPKPLIIAGPCVIESRDHIVRHAEALTKICARTGNQLVFKSSYDKANRTAAGSFRGLGIEQGLKILAEVRANFGVPVITDVHSEAEAEQAGEVVDILQIPAFLSRQTSLLVAAGKTGKAVLIKKGQFLAPEDMKYAAEKVISGGGKQVLLCERGACFGYRDLVVDFRSLAIMADTGWPIIFDATHSVQVMGGGGGVSAGNRRFVPYLARAAVACGVHGLFIECHEDPEHAPSDAATMLPMTQMEALLQTLNSVHAVVENASR